MWASIRKPRSLRGFGLVATVHAESLIAKVFGKSGLVEAGLMQFLPLHPMQEVEVVAVATREATVVEVEASPGLMLGDRGTGWARQRKNCLGRDVDNSVCSFVRTGLSKCVLPPCIYMFESQS